MPEEILTIVRIPVAEIEESLRTKHILPKVLADVRVEGDSLVFCFSDEQQPAEGTASPVLSDRVPRRRRAHRKRNRMRTRGWETVARMINSKGQKCAIYKPFVEALHDPGLDVEEQKSIVAKILKSNRNRPSEASIRYFLENTLEYLQNERTQGQLLPQDRAAE
jgi:hypothetical protein